MAKNSKKVPKTYEERIIFYMRLKKSELATRLAMRDIQEEKYKKFEKELEVDDCEFSAT